MRTTGRLRLDDQREVRYAQRIDSLTEEIEHPPRHGADAGVRFGPEYVPAATKRGGC
ncbi:MAG TPA: hypothetical protein VJL07_04630 [Dehalococcoidia bacterium]|nr:hypothetical protein [Dehalococcoidia bacterium]